MGGWVRVAGMPRKLRLEFAGACYHVINRGNYRADVFKTEGARAAFETCLFEACGEIQKEIQKGSRNSKRVRLYILPY